MSSVPTDNLKALGSGATRYGYTDVQPSLLEVFSNPAKRPGLEIPHAAQYIKITAPEFTSLCPLTGQPDFATIVINYTPDEYCIESKSLKLYLGSFRNVGEFHESCVQRIARDLYNILQPVMLEVEGQFTPRGGIPFWPRVVYSRPYAIPSVAAPITRPFAAAGGQEGAGLTD